MIGAVAANAMLVPGHTPADMAYLINGSVFVGDTLFMPDVGSAHADFPGGDTHELYASMRRLLALPPDTTMYVCHDYPPASRPARWQTTVAEQRADNIQVSDGIGEDEFVAMRQERDATLEVPALILPSIQVNVRAGSRRRRTTTVCLTCAFRSMHFQSIAEARSAVSRNCGFSTWTAITSKYRMPNAYCGEPACLFRSIAQHCRELNSDVTAQSINHDKVDESTPYVCGYELDADPLPDFQRGNSGHQLSLDRGRKNANPRITYRAAGHDGVELLADMRFEE